MLFRVLLRIRLLGILRGSNQTKVGVLAVSAGMHQAGGAGKGRHLCRGLVISTAKMTI
jgi:hypothetical protein